MKDKLMKVKKLFEYLKKINISIETIAHNEVVSCIESKSYYDALGYNEKDYGLCKNIFIRDKKGKNFWLVIVDYQKLIDMDALKYILQSNRKVGFATPHDLTSILDAEPGSLSLFSIINDTSKRVKVVIDKNLMQKEVLAFHPNYRGLTSFVSSSDAIKFLDSLGCEYSILNIPTKNKEFYKEQESSMVKTLAYKM